jgi:hypothetical protein
MDGKGISKGKRRKEGGGEFAHERKIKMGEEGIFDTKE